MFTFLGTVVSEKNVLHAVKYSSLRFGGAGGAKEGRLEDRRGVQPVGEARRIHTPAHTRPQAHLHTPKYTQTLNLKSAVCPRPERKTHWDPTVARGSPPSPPRASTSSPPKSAGPRACFPNQGFPRVCATLIWSGAPQATDLPADPGKGVEGA